MEINFSIRYCLLIVQIMIKNNKKRKKKNLKFINYKHDQKLDNPIFKILSCQYIVLQLYFSPKVKTLKIIY